MGDRSNPDFVPHDDYPTKGYAVSGKIMLSAIVILFAVVIVMVCLHLYARWYLIRARRRQLLNRRRTHIVFYVDPNNPAAATSVTVPSNRGLDASVLKSLPVFVYSSETHPEESLECAVCLSEFEENEKGRTLVKCNHSFHIDCIDMWFHSHSTCPLCRSPVEQDGLVPENREDEVVVTVNEPVETTGNPSSGSSSELCSSCKHGEEGTHRGFWSSSSSSSTAAAATASTSSFGARRKALEMMGGVSIEVPRRNQENSWRSEDEFMTESPASLSFKSPTGGRIRSLKRILSRGLLSPSSGAAGTSCGTGSEFDLERGRDESSTPRSRVGTPRFGGDVSK